MPVDSSALSRSLQRLQDQEDPAGLSRSLQAVAEACVAVFHVTGGGIMVADEQNITRYVAATDGPGRLLEKAESSTGQGPCTQAFVTNEVVPSTDIRADTRWPELAALLAGQPVHAVLGAPVRLGGVSVGTIDVYRDRPHVWDDSEVAAIARYSDVVEAILGSALAAHRAQDLADQLQYALDYRVVIERGVGYLMARDGMDPVAAFGVLRRAARDTQAKIGDVAARLLDTGRLPSDPA